MGTLPATLSFCAAAIAALAGIAAFGVSRAPAWRELRWFALCAFLAAGFELAAIPLTLCVTDEVIVASSRLGLCLGGLHVACWYVYAAKQAGRRMRRVDACLAAIGVVLSLVALVPGTFHVLPVQTRRVDWLGIVYRDTSLSKAGTVAFAFFCVSLARLLLVYVRRWRRREPTAGAHAIALGALLLGAIHDSVAMELAYPSPYLLDSVMIVGVVAVASAATRRFVATARDLEASASELARAHQELVRHERLAALGQLAATVAHEVRNPLAVVFNAVASLRKIEPGAPEHGALLAIVQEEAERLRDIVSDLLEFARPRPVVFAQARLDHVVASAVDAAMSQVEAPPGDVVIDVGEDVPPLLCDELLVRQAVINLVTNALQAEGRRGAVRIVVADSAASVLIRVEDDGRGVPPDLRERIFTPFFSTRPTGTGLGLAVVQRSAESHGGEVVVRPSPAGGATFELRLPRKAA